MVSDYWTDIHQNLSKKSHDTFNAFFGNAYNVFIC